MTLFKTSSTDNLLPFDGEVYYTGLILNNDEANNYMETLQKNLIWKHDEAVIYGKKIVTARKIAWFADTGSDFSYSGTIRKSLPWDTSVMELKELVEEHTNFRFNSCLLNLYHSGMEGMSWHSDKTKEFGHTTTIATLSLGSERRFDLKHTRTGEKVSIVLQHGSLLIMTGVTQMHWLHQVPKTKKIIEPRISLTFRQLL
jgi:alkylated DNA repair dioxygenase AlkB